MVKTIFDFNKAMEEHKAGRELVGIVKRLGGNKEDYKKMYDWVKWNKKSF
jgi:hypothetical protein